MENCFTSLPLVVLYMLMSLPTDYYIILIMGDNCCCFMECICTPIVSGGSAAVGATRRSCHSFCFLRLHEGDFFTSDNSFFSSVSVGNYNQCVLVMCFSNTGYVINNMINSFFSNICTKLIWSSEMIFRKKVYKLHTKISSSLRRSMLKI
jgi:hypothetical protein